MKVRPIELPDHDARRRALDPRGSFIVQAPAGSGKTELLIQRILALLSGVEHPEEVLAITFTRKAAGEMRERLIRALESARGEEPVAEHARATWKLARAVLENDARRDWRLLENPVRLTVQTIDSFCASLVRRMPWLSRFGAGAAIAEDAGDLYRQAAERTLALADSDHPCSEATCLLLGHLDNRMERLCDLLVAMLARRDQWLRHLYGHRPDDRRRILEDGLRSLVEGMLRRLDGEIGAEQRDALVRLGTFAGANLKAEGSENGITILADTGGFPPPSADALHLWKGFAELLLTRTGTLRKRLDKNCGFPAGNKEPLESMKKAMAHLLEELAGDDNTVELLHAVRSLPPVVYGHDQWAVLQALTTLLPRAVAELWLVFKEQGQCDFVEVSQAAGRALGAVEAPTDLLLHLDGRIRHILVDEFQDTSHGQFFLLRKLIAGWQQDDGRTLFLVGDPMQSIYRFREAEVGLYLQARHRGIHPVHLEPLYLTSNFRSQAGIVDWVNGIFPEIFPDREDEALGSVTYAPSIAAREPLDGPAVFCYPMADRDDVAEARQVVELVRRARRDDPTGSVAVLVRARGHLTEILRAFQEAGLSYRAREIDALSGRPVARDLLALTRALLHPADRIAWLAVLRAPWCGLTLDDLHALCGDVPDATVPELLRQAKRLAVLSEDGRQRVERCFGVLNAVLAQRGRVSLRMLVEGAWLALGGPGCADDSATVDAEAFFGLLDQIDYGGDLQPFEMLADKLAGLYAAPDPNADDTLQVMTIHKAKGLEFDTVILPGLGRRPRVEDAPLMRWIELPDTGLLMAPLAPMDGLSRDPVYDTIGRIEKQKSELEIARVLYVAATRAKKYLHLLGYARASGSGECRPAKGSFLEKLWPAVSGFFEELDNVSADRPETARSTWPLRRLPSGWQLPSLPTGAGETPVDILRPSAAARHPVETTLMPETEDGRHIGSLIHAYLERITIAGPEAWSGGRIARERPVFARQLGRMGIADDRLQTAVDRVVLALTTALDSERGRWILSAHDQGACELSLSGVLDGRLVHAEIDRTFVDNKGIRWIVDYKTGDNKGLSPEAFMVQQEQLYRDQLELYARLFRTLEPDREIRCSLYFPLFDGWITL
jgi:ATP-dependent exoDNAse (exonuclease V) beta subunit